MEKLSKLESAVLERLANTYPFLKKQIPYLMVKDRKATGVGMYVNFEYLNNSEDFEDMTVPYLALSTNENIEMEGLEYGLGFEVDITNGKIKFIEFITYGEDTWDGSLGEFRFVDGV